MRWAENKRNTLPAAVTNYSLLFNPDVSRMHSITTVKFQESGSQLVGFFVTVHLSTGCFFPYTSLACRKLRRSAGRP